MKNAKQPSMNIVTNVRAHASTSEGRSSASCSGSVVSADAPELTSRITAIGTATTLRNGTAAR